jgi:hypothetical protein
MWFSRKREGFTPTGYILIKVKVVTEKGDEKKPSKNKEG